MRAKPLSFSLLLSLAALVGCEKNEPKPESTRPEASAPSKVEAIDPSLAEAVAAASAAPKGDAPRAQVEGGPPPDGVFTPGAADKELPRGAAPKVTLGSAGADPKVQLGPSKTAAKQSGTVQVAVQADPRQPALPILLGISVEPKKGEAKAADKAPAAQLVSVRITSAKVDSPGIPKELDEQLAKLKGSKVEYSVAPNGGASGLRVEVAKGAPDDLVHSLSDALGLLAIPYPEQPLGAGGYFMVTSRDELLGLDLVTYRMIKIKEVTPTSVTLDVNTKRYSASRTLELPGMPPDIDKTLFQFEAASEGTVKLTPGALLPSQGELNSVLAAQFQAPDPKRRPSIQLQT
ncbi:MAG TPA: hypothetical protein VEQ59_14620, partial [Polyangiaceae bacterium]|nr:hypothetical protein [Polyangiaceae bacterium]